MKTFLFGQDAWLRVNSWESCKSENLYPSQGWGVSRMLRITAMGWRSLLAHNYFT
ncbi:hypothetical protein [Calothrix sp. NIES-3974]|uniref:hypothetical protein n=1 Tax=Calothrix sp. NIES-3974 TaxID=2005462 RepID=UPI0012FDA4FF|nr:hypothetical protein [Calothrix sp. NIES-3974]